MDTEKKGHLPLSMLTVVCDREKRAEILGPLEGSPAFFHLMLLGRGTANSRILGWLGLGETEKAVTFHILPTALAVRLQEKIDDRLDFKRPGHGISFIADINEICYHKPVKPPVFVGGENMEERTNTHDVIYVVLNRGYTEEVMDAARAVGAVGGTVLHAKGCGLEGAAKFFGVTIQPEKEMIMIVAKKEKVSLVMQEIADKTGPGTDASAVSFSIPVTNVMGVSRDVPQDII